MASNPLATFGELLKKSEIEAARRAAQETERAAIKEATDAARQQSLSHTFGAEPNFEMIGSPQSKDFSLVGEPYGGQPAVIKQPKEALIPEVLPPENMPAVVPPAAQQINAASPPLVLSPERLAEANKAPGMSTGMKLGLGAGSLAAGAALMAGDGAPPTQNDLGGPVDPISSEPAEQQLINNLTDPTDQIAKASGSKLKQASETIRSQDAVKKAPTPLDFTQGSNAGFAEDLRAAQQKQNDIEFVNQLARAGEIAGTSIARSKPVAQQIFEQNIKNADQPVKQLKDKIDNQKNDPNSTESVAAREVLKSMGIPFKGNPSAADLEKVLPRVFQNKQLEETIAARKEIARQQSADRAVQKDLLRQRQEEFLNDRKVRQAREQLDRTKRQAIAGGGNAGNQIRNKIQFADNLFGTVGANPAMTEEDVEKMPAKTFDNVNRTMVAETAMELNRLLTSSGVAAQGTLAKLIPNNIMMDATKVQDYVTNDLNPAEQGEFIKQALKTAARIKSIGQRQNTELMHKYFSGTSRFKDLVPEDYEATLIGLGLNPEQVANYNPNQKNEALLKEMRAQNASKQKAPSAAPSKPKTVIQNGHTYHLNEKTGQYE